MGAADRSIFSLKVLALLQFHFDSHTQKVLMHSGLASSFLFQLWFPLGVADIYRNSAAKIKPSLAPRNGEEVLKAPHEKKKTQTKNNCQFASLQAGREHPQDCTLILQEQGPQIIPQ